MASVNYEEIGDRIYRIETGLYRPGLAACYLVRSGDRLAFVDTGTARTPHCSRWWPAWVYAPGTWTS